MIRPFTCVCLLLAGGSGLYLYQSKHRVQMLDRDIGAIVRQTEAARARTGVLRAEWTLMNDPERLSGLAERLLPLKTTAPGQFTTMADLDNRLPAVRPPEPAHDETTDEDAAAPDAAKPETAKPDPAKPDPAKPDPAKLDPAKLGAPRPVPAPVAAKAAPAKPHPVQVAAQAAPSAPAPSAPPYAQVAASALGRPAAYAPPSYVAPPYAAPAAPRVTPVSAPAAPAPFVGSSLGMARTMAPGTVP